MVIQEEVFMVGGCGSATVQFESKQSHDIFCTFASFFVKLQYLLIILFIMIPSVAKADSSFTIDIDKNGKYDALTDGLLVMRYLMGLRGDALVNGVVDVTGQRTDTTAIQLYLDSGKNSLDVDGSGVYDATDGLQLIRYMFGFGGSALTMSVANPAAMRNAVTIGQYINTLMPIITPPTISTITNQTTNVNTATSTISFTVGDVETAASSLVLSGRSSNKTVVPDANIVFAGSGANRTVTVTPSTGQFGSTTIIITVNDGTITSKTSFIVNVKQVPTAFFTVSPLAINTLTTFQFDASDSFDPVEATSTLQIRWDWEGDGSWDTSFSTIKTASHQFMTAGIHTVKMEVKNSEGVVATMSYPLMVVIVPIAKTGQSTSYSAGDDGNLKKGVTWPDPRFTNNGNGTVTDNLTGLIWLQNADCFGIQSTWDIALTSANELANGSCGLSDGSKAGDWRMPNRNEMRSLIDYGHYAPALPSVHPFLGVDMAYEDIMECRWLVGCYSTGVKSTVALPYNFWTSTTDPADTLRVVTMNLVDGTNYSTYWDMTSHFLDLHLWPVKGSSTQISPAPVLATGQIYSYFSGDDGEFQEGVTSLTSRFLDNGDGTITDTLTGLIWLQDVRCWENISWSSVLGMIADFNAGIPHLYGCRNYTGKYIDWRLPNINELTSLLDMSRDPSLSNVFKSFLSLSHHTFWSSTASAGVTSKHWIVNTSFGGMVTIHGGVGYILPVRGGFDHQPPLVSTIINQSTRANSSTNALSFKVGAMGTAADSLMVSGSSSNKSLVPDANIIFGGSGSSRTVTITPAADQSGSTTITVNVNNGTTTTSTTFMVTITPDLDLIPPTDPEITLLVANDTDSVTVAWLPAQDDKSSNSRIRYELHMATIPNFTPSVTSKRLSAMNEYKTVVTNLNANTTYYVTVLAFDEAGNSSQVNTSLSITTMAEPVVMSSTLPLSDASKLHLGEPTITGDQYTFARSSNTVVPNVASILVGPLGETGYLRKIDQVATMGSQIVMNTSSASLKEVMDKGQLNSMIRLFDVSQAVTAKQKISQAQLDDFIDSNSYTTEWKDHLLSATQVNYVLNRTDGLQASFSPSNKSYQLMYANSSAVSQPETLTLNAQVNFDPVLETKAHWNLLAPSEAEVILTGELSVDINADYNFTKIATYAPDAWPLFSRTFYAAYLVGGVPVYQESTLTVSAQVSATSTGSIHSNAHAQAVSALKIGVRFNPVTKVWDPLISQGFTQSMTADLSVKGGVTAEIRIIPKVEVKFYKTFGAALTVEPFVKSDIEYAMNIDADILKNKLEFDPFQPSAFDTQFDFECKVSVGLTSIFGNMIPLLPEKELCGNLMQTVTLFDLPEISLSNCEIKDGKFVINAVTRDGVNDVFNDASVIWSVFPITMSRATNGKQLIITPDPNVAETTVYFSGYGILGNLGRQFSKTTCIYTNIAPIALFTVTPTSGDNKTTFQFDASGSSDVEDAVSALQVQWDWEGDGIWDTSYSTSKIASHQFTKDGTYIVKMQVKDTGGVMTTTSHTVTVLTCSASGDYINSLCMTFKQIPAGTFTMGSALSADLLANPPHSVTISKTFYMQTTEVTQRQWQAVMGSNPSYFSSCGDNCPVERVYLNDLNNIQTFLTKLNAMGEGRYSLPTEAQWEYAARAGTTTAYSFGDDASQLGSYAWFGFNTAQGGNASETTHPVATKLPNSWGLYDMHGNVAEVVADWFGNYSSTSLIDPVGPLNGSMRVFRGGSWGSRDNLRSAERGSFIPANALGLRLVRETP